MNQTTASSSKQIWLLVITLLALILLVAAYKLNFFMDISDENTAVFDESCDLRQGACTVEIPSGGIVEFSMSPNDIPVLRPLELNVSLNGINADDVQVDFIGLNLDMGYNRRTLKKNTTNHYTGGMVIPVCVRSTMRWEARVLIQSDKGRLMAPFRFSTFN